MIHVCPECGYNDVIEDKVISGHKGVINMTDKDREDARVVIDAYLIDPTGPCRKGLPECWESMPVFHNAVLAAAAEIARIRAEAARKERERILNAVNILITAWSVDHKDWREFGVGYTSALEQVAGMIRKDLTPESATEQRTCETCDEDRYEYKGAVHQRVSGIWFRIAGNTILDRDQYRHDLEERAKPVASPRPVSAEDVETVREYVLSTIGSHHKPRERDILAALDRIAGKEEWR